MTGFPLALQRTDKAAIRALLRSGRRSAGRWSVRDGELVTSERGIEVKVPLGPLERAVAEGRRVYEAGRRRIESRPEVMDGEPVFAGTRIPLERVAAHFRREIPREEIKEDFPRLSDDELAYAQLVARIKRDPGRPRRAVELYRNGAVVETGKRGVGGS